MTHQVTPLPLKISKLKTRRVRQFVFAILRTTMTGGLFFVMFVAVIVAVIGYQYASEDNSVKELIYSLIATGIAVIGAFGYYHLFIASAKTIRGFKRTQRKLKKLIKRQAIQEEQTLPEHV